MDHTVNKNGEGSKYALKKSYYLYYHTAAVLHKKLLPVSNCNTSWYVFFGTIFFHTIVSNDAGGKKQKKGSTKAPFHTHFHLTHLSGDHVMPGPIAKTPRSGSTTMAQNANQYLRGKKNDLLPW